MTHEDYMKAAISLAKEAAEEGEVPVGAVVYQCNEEKGTATAVPREEDEFFD